MRSMHVLQQLMATRVQAGSMALHKHPRSFSTERFGLLRVRWGFIYAVLARPFAIGAH
jgi:hypothetical protein